MGNRAWDEAYYCDQYWAIGNMAENMNNILMDFINNPDLNNLSRRLDDKLSELEGKYSQRFSDPVTGALNTATWNAYQTLRDFTQGNVSETDVQRAVNNAYAEIDAFLSNSSSNQREFQDAVNSLNATAASAGDITNQTQYTQGYQGSTHTGGAQAAGSILGLETIEQLLSLCTLAVK